jgi:LPXTG-motif cell wall-anchored protein
MSIFGDVPIWVLIVGFIVLLGLIGLLLFLRNKRPED